MKVQEVERAAWRGAVSNYGRVALRLSLGVITFRMLYQGLDDSSFGFWSLLWSVFGYGVLLDFGFGSAAQKRVAVALSDRDWPGLSQALSTIFFFYVAVAIGIAIGGWVLADPFLSLLGVSAEDREVFRPATRAFFLGMALAFPGGIFPEVLRGLQRMEVANRIAMVGLVINALFIAVALWLDWSLAVLIAGALGCVIVPDFISGWVALRALPHVRLRPGLFSLDQWWTTSKFSLCVWVSTASQVLRNKSDQLVVGVLISLPAVALYQAAGKVAEIFGMAARQISEALCPAAAYLHARGHKEALRDCFLKGLRFTVLIATPGYVCAAIHVDFLIFVLTGEESPSEVILTTAQLLLLWCYQMTITHLVFRRMFVMCGQERRLMWQGLSEALLNVALSVVFTFWLKSIVGVALGSLIPAVLFGWAVLWRWASREVEIKAWTLFRTTSLKPILACVPMVIVGLGLRGLLDERYGQPDVMKACAGLAAMGVVGALGLWFIALEAAERSRLGSLIRSRIARGSSLGEGEVR